MGSGVSLGVGITATLNVILDLNVIERTRKKRADGKGRMMERAASRFTPSLFTSIRHHFSTAGDVRGTRTITWWLVESTTLEMEKSCERGNVL